MGFEEICSKLDVSEKDIEMLKRVRKRENRLHYLIGFVSSIISFIGGLFLGAAWEGGYFGYPYTAAFIFPAVAAQKNNKIWVYLITALIAFIIALQIPSVFGQAPEYGVYDTFGKD